MRVEIKVTAPRASGKTHLIEFLEEMIRLEYRQVRLLNRVPEVMIDGIPVELIELEVTV